MPFAPHRCAAVGGFLMLLMATAAAAPLQVTVRLPPAPLADGFHLGASRRPDGSTLAVDRASLRLNGRPWIPAMGEFHYARYPANEWREELLKMKAGGIEVVATYVFWIYHEEIEGRWDWAGQRNLREFIRLAGETGLQVVVRCGPWCHGEVRNGGFPDWLLQKGWASRSDDPRYLAPVRVFYGQIADQLRGLRWKDGGPVIGVQVENEYSGPAEHLLTLKRIAGEVGLDVPLYTRTGWPALGTPMPFGEIVPLYGSYAEGFWDRELTAMPGGYWTRFRFSTKRIDGNIANEQLGRDGMEDPPDAVRYPYLTCEIGGGMISSYHRRILVDPADVETTVLVKVGSGSTLPGYYMYHGGTNPDGELTTLMEAQDTPSTNHNDLPVKDYDYQAPLGQYGQIRAHYHWLRRLHLFLHDFGGPLAAMPPALPDLIPEGRDDLTTLRWAVRSDGVAGFVFVCNYERARRLPAKADVQFAIKLPGGRTLTFPAAPVTVAAGSRFFWPFNLELGHGVALAWATAQPVCLVDDGDVRTVFFAETAGVPAQFALAGEPAPRTVAAGRAPALRVRGTDGAAVQIVLLSEADSLALWKGEWRGRARVFLTRAGLVLDGDQVRLTSRAISDLQLGVFPAPVNLAGGVPDGVFMRFVPPPPPRADFAASVIEIQAAGAAREVPLGRAPRPVAEQPSDADFARAAVWRIRLPDHLDLSTDPILRVHYVGDVARITLNGRLVTDDFYNGNAWEIGLRRHAPAILQGDLRIAILPLRKDTVTGPGRKVYLADELLPDFGKAASVARLQSVEIIPRYQVAFPDGGAR